MTDNRAIPYEVFLLYGDFLRRHQARGTMVKLAQRENDDGSASLRWTMIGATGRQIATFEATFREGSDIETTTKFG